MLVEFISLGKTKIIEVSGEISFENNYEFRDSILKGINGDESLIIIDMKKVTHLNSMGIGVVVKAYSEAKKQNKSLVLCSLKDNIRKLFKITRLDEIIKIYGNRNEVMEIDLAHRM